MVDLEGKGLEETDVDVHEFFIVKVEVKLNQLVQKWVTQNIVYKFTSKNVHFLVLVLMFCMKMLEV